MFIDDVVNDLAYELNSNNVEKRIEGISDYLSIIVVYNEHISCVMKFKGYHVIYIKQDENNKMWEDFTHELVHFILPDTEQRYMNYMYNQKQENEANKFSLLFRMLQKEIEFY